MLHIYAQYHNEKASEDNISKHQYLFDFLNWSFPYLCFELGLNWGRWGLGWEVEELPCLIIPTPIRASSPSPVSTEFPCDLCGNSSQIQITLSVHIRILTDHYQDHWYSCLGTLSRSIAAMAAITSYQIWNKEWPIISSAFAGSAHQIMFTGWRTNSWRWVCWQTRRVELQTKKFVFVCLIMVCIFVAGISKIFSKQWFANWESYLLNFPNPTVYNHVQAIDTEGWNRK